MTEPIVKAFGAFDKWVKKYGNTTLFVIITASAVAIAQSWLKLEMHAKADEARWASIDKVEDETKTLIEKHEAQINALSSGIANIDGKLEIILRRLPE